MLRSSLIALCLVASVTANLAQTIPTAKASKHDNGVLLRKWLVPDCSNLSLDSLPKQSVTDSAAREVGTMHSSPHDQTTEARIGAVITKLPAMNRAALLKVWAKTFPTPPPPKLRKELMVPILAYRMQEAEYGGLSHSARTRLQVLIEKNRAAPSRRSGPRKPAEVTSKLIRSWRGEVHEVIVTETGFIYRGEAYAKLSPIAKRITGTQWSGPAFFGTRPKDRQP